MTFVTRPLIGSLFVLAFALIGACSSDAKDPMENWGAAQRYNEFVPLTAQSGAKGTGALTYTAPANGILYVLDTSTQVDVDGVPKPRVIVAGYLTDGTLVIFNPEEKRVHAKGKRGIALTNVDPTHSHELRFDPSTASSKGIAP